jgi:hypothetical protein
MACENIPELGCNGALTELLGLLGDQLKRRPFPRWFAEWPDKEAEAKRLRSFEPQVIPGLLQIIEDPGVVDALAHTWDTLRLEALPPAASLTLIEEIRKEL